MDKVTLHDQKLGKLHLLLRIAGHGQRHSRIERSRCTTWFETMNVVASASFYVVVSCDAVLSVTRFSSSTSGSTRAVPPFTVPSTKSMNHNPKA